MTILTQKPNRKPIIELLYDALQCVLINNDDDNLAGVGYLDAQLLVQCEAATAAYRAMKNREARQNERVEQEQRDAAAKRELIAEAEMNDSVREGDTLFAYAPSASDVSAVRYLRHNDNGTTDVFSHDKQTHLYQGEDRDDAVKFIDDSHRLGADDLGDVTCDECGVVVAIDDATTKGSGWLCGSCNDKNEQRVDAIIDAIDPKQDDDEEESLPTYTGVMTTDGKFEWTIIDQDYGDGSNRTHCVATFRGALHQPHRTPQPGKPGALTFHGTKDECQRWIDGYASVNGRDAEADLLESKKRWPSSFASFDDYCHKVVQQNKCFCGRVFNVNVGMCWQHYESVGCYDGAFDSREIADLANVIDICGPCAGVDEGYGFIDTSREGGVMKGDWTRNIGKVTCIESAMEYVIERKYNDSAMLDTILTLTDMGVEDYALGDYQNWCRQHRVNR